MASVFLSYDRRDLDRAGPLAKLLERAGHAVWWDRHIKGGRQYAHEIEQALDRSDAVVVLWSEKSVASAWVRDEAAAGRDAGKLVPVALGPVTPPLGFRQFQVIDLSGWRGRRSVPQLDQLLASVEALGKETNPTEPLSSRATPPRPGATKENMVRWLGAGLAGAVLLILAVGLWSFDRESARLSVTAIPGNANPASRQLSGDLLIRLSSLQQQEGATFEILSGEQAAKSAYQLRVTADQASVPETSLALIAGEDGRILWSDRLQPASGQLSDLKQQLTYVAARVLRCLGQAEGASGTLEPDILTLHLRACAELAERLGGDPTPVLPLLRQVTEKAPDFPGGWSNLLLALSTELRPGEFDTTPTDQRSLSQAVSQARSRHPGLSELALAELQLLPDTDFGRRMALLDKALAADPNDAPLLAKRAEHLASLGRWNDAIENSRAATEADSFNSAYRSAHILTLAFAGHDKLAGEELAKAERLWPGATNLKETRFWLHMRFGDPATALELLRQGVTRLPPVVETVLLAKIEPTPENEARARAFVRNGLTLPRIGGPMQGTVIMGIEDELWPILLRRENLRRDEVSVLMYPMFRSFRHDPRFFLLAQKGGVLRHWRESGKWPDFCFEPDLPYKCEERAKAFAA